jgi:hypothetical protein
LTRAHAPAEGYEALWRALFRPETVAPPAAPGLEAAAARFAEHVSPALAAYLLEPAAATLGPLVDPARAREARLLGRFNLAAQRKCLALVQAAGVEAVALKGFANAHLIYPEPELRLFGDLDLLIRPQALGPLTKTLAAEGYRFEPPPEPPWGFMAEGSFVPFVSADDACNLDLHLEPDSYPIGRALTAERIFAAARSLQLGDLALRVPSAEHALILCISNAAKDKFGPYSVRKLIDGQRILAQQPGLDWDGVVACLRAGQSLLPARVFFALLARLGAPLPALPAILTAPLGGWRTAELERLVADYRALFPRPLGWLDLLRREALLCAEPRVALHMQAKRLAGLLRPRTGLPPGWEPPPRSAAASRA